MCTPCRTILQRLDTAEREGGAVGGAGRQPNPANPMEYCSTVPVSEQVSSTAVAPALSVMVPTGVLKRQAAPSSEGAAGAAAGVSTPDTSKSVMFR